MRKTQSGFSTLETLLVVVIVGLIGFIGWYVWNAKQASQEKSDTTQASQTTNTKPAPQTKKPEEVPAGYKKFESTDGAFSFLYPSAWLQKNPESTSVMVGPVADDLPNVYVWQTTPNHSNCAQTTEALKDLTVGGQAAKQFKGGSMTSKITTCVDYKQKTYLIEYAYTTDEATLQQEYDKLLTSFKFTDR